jgi:hypothetical protein
MTTNLYTSNILFESSWSQQTSVSLALNLNGFVNNAVRIRIELSK